MEAGLIRSSVLAFADPSEGVLNLDVKTVPFGRLRWCLDRSLNDRLKRILERCSAIHIHGLWQEHVGVVVKEAERTATPFSISAHGMLDSWALTQGRIKKAVYLRLVELPNLKRAKILRALTLDEISDYRRIGLRNPVAFIPNGVDIAGPSDPHRFLQAFPHCREKSIVLFLGRLHPKKGLDLLVRSWKHVASIHPEAHLILAGPADLSLGLAWLTMLVKDQGVTNSVTFTGMLNRAMVSSALAACRVFTLPSYSEGFSVAVLEALAAARPVILSDQCRFPEIEREGCGWVTKLNTSDLTDRLLAALSMSYPEIELLGANGRAMVDRKYSWEVISRQMSDLTEYMCGGPRPISFSIDE